MKCPKDAKWMAVSVYPDQSLIWVCTVYTQTAQVDLGLHCLLSDCTVWSGSALFTLRLCRLIWVCTVYIQTVQSDLGLHCFLSDCIVWCGSALFTLRLHSLIWVCTVCSDLPFPKSSIFTICNVIIQILDGSFMRWWEYEGGRRAVW